MTLPSPAFSPASTVGRGMAFFLLSILLFTLLDALAKDLVGRIPFVQVVWARFAVQLVLVLAFLRGDILPMLHTRVPGLHLARALTQLGAGGFFFASLAHIGLAEATALADINPVLITLGAALFLGERLGPRRVAAVLVSMAGACMIIRPGSDAFSPAAVLPLLGAVCYAANALITRAVGQSEPVARVILISSLICTGLVTLALPFYWQPIPLADVPRLIAIGVLGTGAQVLIIRAFSTVEASVLAPFGYVGIVLAAVWGWLFFGEWPDVWTQAGILVIILAGVYVWYRETQVDRPGTQR